MIEGLSFLILLFIAMPLKYQFSMPEAVSFFGPIHGGLFLIYIAFIVMVVVTRTIGIWAGLACVIASVLPFGPFVVDRLILKKHEQRNLADSSQQ